VPSGEIAAPTACLDAGHLGVSTSQKWLSRFGCRQFGVPSGTPRTQGKLKLAIHTPLLPSTAITGRER
jgi:hypothetical protein